MLTSVKYVKENFI